MNNHNWFQYLSLNIIQSFFLNLNRSVIEVLLNNNIVKAEYYYLIKKRERERERKSWNTAIFVAMYNTEFNLV